MYYENLDSLYNQYPNTNKFSSDFTKPPILIKHIAAIHAESSLSIKHHQVANMLLYYAQPELSHCQNEHKGKQSLIHTLPISLLKKTLHEFEDSSNEKIAKILTDLTTLSITWNILKRDRKNTWYPSPLLAKAYIDNDQVHYTYTPETQERLGQPNIFAKLNLNIQRKLCDTSIEQRISHHHAFILWEVLCAELCLKRESNIITAGFSPQILRRLLQRAQTTQEDKENIIPDRHTLSIELKQACLVLNDKSDLMVEYEEYKTSNQNTCIRFHVNKKTQKQQVAQIHDLYKTHIAPVAEHAFCKYIRQIICETIGAPDYKSWFERTSCAIEDSTLVITAPSSFILSYLEINYKHMIERTLKIVDTSSHLPYPINMCTLRLAP